MDKRTSRGATECGNPLCSKESTKVVRAGNRMAYVCDSILCESAMTEIIQERRDRTQPLGDYLPKKRKRRRREKNRRSSRHPRSQKKR